MTRAQPLALAIAVAAAAFPASGRAEPPADEPEREADSEPQRERESDPDAAEAAPPPPAGELERPRLLRDAVPRYPQAAWDRQIEADVIVLITIDEQGEVTEVELAEGAGHGFDEDALLAARKLRFSAARVDGEPAPVQIRYTFRFRIPEKQTVAEQPGACVDGCPADERKPGRIRATVYERGRGGVLRGVEVYVLDEDRVVLTDDDGRFELEGPPGAYAFTIRPPGFYPFNATERVEAGEELDLVYYVRRHRRSRYSTIVWGSEGRAEVARTSLVDDEIRTIPGTLGDPLRVAMLLPGVASSVSGLGYPIVRGSLPSDTQYEIDGIPVPMLYHLLFGPAVFHSRFVDQISYQPGGYSAEHGRFPGGRIAATTARVDDEPVLIADLSLIETSLFRSQKVGEGSEVVAAVRYGTLGYIIEGLSSDIIFRYWDYQSRLGHRLPGGGKLTLTVLGASDTVGDKDPFSGEENVLRIGFHKADLRYRHGFSRGWAQVGTQVGHEFFRPGQEEELGEQINGDASLQSVRTYGEAGLEVGELALRVGGDVLYQDFGLTLPGDTVFLFTADTGTTLGAWTSADWRIRKLVLSPSVRLDHYRYQAETDRARETSVNPRFAASYDLTGDVVLKAAAGIYSGPSRLSFVEPPVVFGPIPAFEGPGLSRGLSRSTHYQIGAEAKLPGDLQLVVTTYLHDTRMPIDFSLIDKDLAADPTPCSGGGPVLVQPFDVSGRSLGAEMLLRRRLGRSVFGWASYTLSRSERDIPGVGVIPFDFDQTHVFNGVVSWEVGRNWTVGSVLHVNSGRPYTPLIVDNCGPGAPFPPVYQGRRGEPNSDRLPGYWRLDLRVQKREVFDTWFFDFYIDFFNAAFQFETIGFQLNSETGELEPEKVPLFIPLVGIRGEF